MSGGPSSSSSMLPNPNSNNNNNNNNVPSISSLLPMMSTSAVSAAATNAARKMNNAVPASNPFQLTNSMMGLSMTQQAQFKQEFDRKRKELEVQQKRLQQEMLAKHRQELVRFIKVISK